MRTSTTRTCSDLRTPSPGDSLGCTMLCRHKSGPGLLARLLCRCSAAGLKESGHAQSSAQRLP